MKSYFCGFLRRRLMRPPTLKQSANPTTGPGRSAARRATAALCEQGTLSVCYPHEAVTAVCEQRLLSALLAGVSRLKLVSNGKNEDDVFGREPTVLRDVPGTAARGTVPRLSQNSNRP
jgi:hypothetical protein